MNPYYTLQNIIDNSNFGMALQPMTKNSFALDKRDCQYLWFIFCYEEKIIIGSKQITFWHCHQLCFFAKSRSPKRIMHPPKERKKLPVLKCVSSSPMPRQHIPYVIDFFISSQSSTVHDTTNISVATTKKKREEKIHLQHAQKNQYEKLLSRVNLIIH